MIRFRFVLLILITIGIVSAQTQPSSVVIQIGSQVTGPRFMVDGQVYTAQQTFSWPAGSKHILQFLLDQAPAGQQQTPIQTSTDGSIQWSFGGWKDNAGLLSPASDTVQTVTADPSITSFTATVSTAYRVNLSFYNSPNLPASCGGSPGSPPPGALPGVVYLNSTCYATSTTLYVPAGPLTLNAFPYPGFVFVGWSINGSSPSAFLTTFNINAAASISAVFETGKRVLFVTNPPGLEVLIDRTPVPTSPITPCSPNLNLPPNAPATITPLCFGEFDFIPGSTHVISGVSPQLDSSGNTWVFDHWSNGLGPNAFYTTDTNLGAETTLTAFFVAGAQASFLTNPSGLQLTVDGRTNWPSYNFTWPVGSTHQVAAPATQTDAKGRVWTFQSWSNGGAAGQTVTLPQGGMRLAANFSVQSQATIQSNPSGLTFQVNSGPCQTPCVVNQPSGTQIQVSAPASLPINNGARWDFRSWSDGGASNSRLLTFNTDTQTIVANYQTSYLLTVAANPASGASFQISPSTVDMYYPANSQVAITAAPNNGFKFLAWSGDLNGTYPGTAIQMTGPMSAVVMLGRVPFIAPAGVQSAAGATPDGSVAPGSIISIYGESLAPTLQVGSTNPLPQTLANVTVTVGSQILPLLFVSPEQINAQVPVELSDGSYTLAVHSQGQPDITAQFTVSRDAPALFSRPANNVPCVMASHADGTPVSMDSPAQSGETLTVFGTGFGPYAHAIVDGFLISDPATYTMADPVQVNAGNDQVQPIWSGAAAGLVGTTATTFQVPGDLPSGTTVPFTVTVNGKASNIVMLPLQ